jgi:tetratricopeptide (TPR) repeat protein
MSRIFLSCGNKDDLLTLAICDWLKENGWDDVRRSVDPTQGIQRWDRSEFALYENMRHCEAVVFLISRDWLSSNYGRIEYELARKLNKRIFVALIDELTIDDLPFFLIEKQQAVSLVSNKDQQVLRVTQFETQDNRTIAFSSGGLAQLKTGLTQTGVDPSFFNWPPEDEPGRAPYRGLEPLQELDAGIFFGRDEPLIEAFDVLRGLAETAGPRLFVILGESGAGKSSFLRAGLWSRLARDEGRFMPMPVIRPGNAVISGSNGFLAALASVAESHDLCMSRAQIREAIAAGANALRPLLGQLAERAAVTSLGSRSPTFLIAIDQAEELFQVEDKSESQNLLTLLRDLSAFDSPPIILVFAIRTDFYDMLERESVFEGSYQRVFTLPPMRRDGYQMVINGPAKRLVDPDRQFEIDPTVVQSLIDAAEGATGDNLPLLSFTLEQLYRSFSSAKRIDQSDYARFGALSGSFDVALGRVFSAADADPHIPKGEEARLSLLRQVIIPWLADINLETRMVRRRIASAKSAPENARFLIDLLVEQRLVTRSVDAETSETTLELSHEALLRRWGRLRGWLDEEFGRLATLQGVKQAAHEWNANARSKTWALHSGASLQQAERLYTRPDFTALLASTDRAYLAACIQKEKAHREAAIVQSRLGEQLKLEQNELRLPPERNARRTTWRYSIGLTVALAFGIFALVANRGNSLPYDLAQKLKHLPGLSAPFAWDILNRARRLRDELVASAVNDDDVRRKQSVALNQVVEARLAVGDINGAFVAAQQSVHLMEALSASNPADAGWRRDLSVSYEKLGDVEIAQIDFAGALKSYRTDLAIAEALAASDPDNAQWQWDLSVSNERMGDVQQAQGDLAGALKSYRAAMAIREAVSAAHERNAGWRREVAVSHERIGATLEKQNDPLGAVAAFERALAVYHELLRARPDDAKTAVFSVVPHLRLAELDRSKQRENLGAALAILEPLATANRLDEKRRGWLMQIRTQLAALDQFERQPQETTAERRKELR